MDIIIPVGGKARRFYDAGYTTYKPFLPIGDKTMIERVWENIKTKDSRLILSVRPQDKEEFQKLFPEALVIVDDKQMGAAGGVLACKDFLSDKPCMVANSDQFVDMDIEKFVDTDLDGRILTFYSDDPKWSYAKTDGELVTYCVEKEVVSKHATVGIYYYKSGLEMIKAIERMVEDEFRVNGEFYLCPAYNFYPRNKKIGIYEIREKEMYGLGIPQDYTANAEKVCRIAEQMADRLDA